MKTLHLKLKRDVLIVDGQLSRMEALELRAKGWTFLCQGTPTEEQAAELVEKVTTTLWKNYEKVPDYFEFLKNSAVESFLSAISAEGWHWLVNPIELIERGEDTEHNRVKNQNDWRDAESRTFKNPYIFIKE